MFYFDIIDLTYMQCFSTGLIVIIFKHKADVEMRIFIYKISYKIVLAISLTRLTAEEG